MLELQREILNYKDFPIRTDIKVSELRPAVKLRAAYIMHALSNPILFKDLSETSIECLLIRRIWAESNIHWIDYGLGLDKTIDSTMFRNYLVHEYDNIEIGLKKQKRPDLDQEEKFQKLMKENYMIILLFDFQSKRYIKLENGKESLYLSCETALEL